MPAANAIRNKKQFVKWILDAHKGEQIVNGSVDGMAHVIHDYHAYYANENAPTPKEYHMTLFPTNQRVVVYQAKTYPRRDVWAQIPLAEIEEITFLKVNEKRRLVCVTEFISADDSRYPSIIFKMDCTGHPDDLAQYMVILDGIAKLAGVKISDYTAPEMR